MAFKSSIARLMDFVSTREISYILGNHIEMTREPKVDFQSGVTFHPNERELQLEVQHFVELHESLNGNGNVPASQVLDDFIIVPLPPIS